MQGNDLLARLKKHLEILRIDKECNIETLIKELDVFEDSLARLEPDTVDSLLAIVDQLIAEIEKNKTFLEERIGDAQTKSRALKEYGKY